MGFKIPNLPSSRAYKEELADFWELEAILNPETYVSHSQIAGILNIGHDELNPEGIEGEEAEVFLDQRLDDTFKELNRRIHSTGNKYPFSFERYSIIYQSSDGFYEKIYLFLLLCTRFNMNYEKVHKGIDATQVFEKLCNHAAKNFFGKNSNSLILGTATSGSFVDKVKSMIKQIGEGGGFVDRNNASTKNDDGIDIVVWRDFADRRIGKLMGFGQCKTGTSWRNSIHHLNPEGFIKCWFKDPVVLVPIAIVFLCDTMFEELNFFQENQNRLIFNRFRIMEYIEQETLEETIFDEIALWLEGALEKLSVS